MSDKQWNIIYYKLEEGDVLFAYGDYYEFFERYDAKSESWRPSEVSYSRVFHHLHGIDVGAIVGGAISGGPLPYEKYAEYRRFLSGSSPSGEGK